MFRAPNALNQRNRPHRDALETGQSGTPYSAWMPASRKARPQDESCSARNAAISSGVEPARSKPCRDLRQQRESRRRQRRQRAHMDVCAILGYEEPKGPLCTGSAALTRDKERAARLLGQYLRRPVAITLETRQAQSAAAKKP